MDAVKKPRGRPPEGLKIEVRLPADVVAEIDRAAAASGLRRAQLIRQVLVRHFRR